MMAPQTELRESFRAAFRRLAGGVAVITYLDDRGRVYGVTATAVCPLSIDPPSVLVCLNREARSRDAIVATGQFSVALLAEGKEQVSNFCSRPGSRKELYESWLQRSSDAGVGPMLRDAVAQVACTVERVHEEYTHSIVVGRVDHVWLGPWALPLVYFDGAYRKLGEPTKETIELLWEQIASSYP